MIQTCYTNGIVTEQFRIPKIAVPITCHTVEGEKISGEIFLDALSSDRYSPSQLLDYLNAPFPFFPIRPPGAPKPLLLRKDSIVQIDIPKMLDQIQEEPTTPLAVQREAVLYSHHIGPIRATVFLDLPEEYLRILDLLNLGKNFFAAIVNETFVLLNAFHIYKVEEL